MPNYVIMALENPLFWIGIIAAAGIDYALNKSVVGIFGGLFVVTVAIIIVVSINDFTRSYEQPSSHCKKERPEKTIYTPIKKLGIFDY